MPFSKTYNVIYLGTAGELDPTEGNTIAENAASLVNSTFGSIADPLCNHVSTMAPVVPTDTWYSQNNAASYNQFTINGGAAQNFDATVHYHATITYADGSTVNVTAVVFQDTDGRLYLAPEAADNADTASYLAQPIRSLTLNTVQYDTHGNGMSVSRFVTDFVCFTDNTRIETDQGEKPALSLQAGDLIRTADHGYQPIRWIGRKTVPLDRSEASTRYRPIRIRAGALGAGLPKQDLYVSQQHRILVRSEIAQDILGAGEVLIPAKKLLDIDGVDIVTDCDEVTYVHFLFDRHEVVYSNGAATESLYTGPEALKAVGPEALTEIMALFPELADIEYRARSARIIPSGKAAKALVRLHATNSIPLYAA